LEKSGLVLSNYHKIEAIRVEGRIGKKDSEKLEKSQSEKTKNKSIKESVKIPKSKSDYTQHNK